LRKYLNIFKELVAELGFLTILPVQAYDIDTAARGLYWSPLIGSIIGALSIFPAYLPVDPLLKGVTTFVLLYLFTGLLHLDGYADFCDVLGSGFRGEDALRVLKDPRKGAKAISCTFLLLVTVYASLLVILRENPLIVTFVNAGVYESLYLTSLLGEPPEYKGLGRLFIRYSRRTVHLNILIIIIILAVLAMIRSAIDAFGFGLGLIASLISSAYSSRKSLNILGMVNGDVIGFSLELARALGFLVLAFAVGWG